MLPWRSQLEIVDTLSFDVFNGQSDFIFPIVITFSIRNDSDQKAFSQKKYKICMFYYSPRYLSKTFMMFRLIIIFELLFIIN